MLMVTPAYLLSKEAFSFLKETHKPVHCVFDHFVFRPIMVSFTSIFCIAIVSVFLLTHHLKFGDPLQSRNLQRPVSEETSLHLFSQHLYTSAGTACMLYRSSLLHIFLFLFVCVSVCVLITASVCCMHSCMYVYGCLV